MKGLLTLMMIVLLCVIAAAVYKLYKNLKSTDREESAREAFLQALCEETARKKRESENTAENIKSQSLEENIAKQETSDREVITENKLSEPEDAKKEAAVNMVMNMLGNSKSKGSAADELQEMMRSLSQKNK
ncbi:MAG: hypothetical protein E7510_07520 [Ruminococcus sp.]|nr:hypothetical protein [Ruminococcus sp.]